MQIPFLVGIGSFIAVILEWNVKCEECTKREGEQSDGSKQEITSEKGGRSGGGDLKEVPSGLA